MKFNKKYVFTNPSDLTPLSQSSQSSPSDSSNVSTSLEENLSKARESIGEFVGKNYIRPSSSVEKMVKRIKKNKDKLSKRNKKSSKFSKESTSEGDDTSKGEDSSEGDYKPERPINAYSFFCREKRGDVIEELDTYSGAKVLKRIGELWKQLSDKDKEKYKVKAEKDKKRYEEEMKIYNKSKSKEVEESKEDEVSKEDEESKEVEKQVKESIIEMVFSKWCCNCRKYMIYNSSNYSCAKCDQWFCGDCDNNREVKKHDRECHSTSFSNECITASSIIAAVIIILFVLFPLAFIYGQHSSFNNCLETNNDTYFCHYNFRIAPANLTMFPSVEKCGYCYDLRFESLRNKEKPMCRSITEL